MPDRRYYSVILWQLASHVSAAHEPGGGPVVTRHDGQRTPRLTLRQLVNQSPTAMRPGNGLAEQSCTR